MTLYLRRTSEWYTEGKNPPRSWWENCVYKGLRQVAEDNERVKKADTTGCRDTKGRLLVGLFLRESVPYSFSVIVERYF